jgi:hypothetical protein
LFYVNYVIFQPKKNTTAHLTPASFVSQAKKTAGTIADATSETPKSMFRKSN